MKLSKTQVEWINNEKRFFEDIIASKKAQGIYTGLGHDQLRLYALQTIIKLHNVELDYEKSQKKPEKGLTEGLC